MMTRREVEKVHGHFILLRDDLLRGEPERGSVEEAAAQDSTIIAGMLEKYLELSDLLSILDFDAAYNALREMRDMQADIGSAEGVSRVDLAWKAVNRLQDLERKTRDVAPVRR